MKTFSDALAFIALTLLVVFLPLLVMPEDLILDVLVWRMSVPTHDVFITVSYLPKGQSGDGRSDDDPQPPPALGIKCQGDPIINGYVQATSRLMPSPRTNDW